MSRRRAPGEGHVFHYDTKAGIRYAFKFDLPREGGRRKQVVRRGYLTERDALRALRRAQSEAEAGRWVEPSKQPTGGYLTDWLNGLRLAPSTVASYRKNVRLHIDPYVGSLPLASLTTAKIDAVYRQLEDTGRRDHKANTGLSARTVRYVHTILSAALAAAVDAGQLAANPAAKAHPPTAKQAASPEMQVWTTGQLAAFLGWSAEHSHFHSAWHVLAHTGMRRGELLALRWRDIDLEGGTVSIRRSAGIVRVKGQGANISEGPTKTGKARVVDLDDTTVALLRAHRRDRGALMLTYARNDAVVFGDHEGRTRHPERFSRLFAEAVTRCRRDLATDDLPLIRLHDLRHTHATHLLASGEQVKVVSERLGHANPTITMTVYAHVLPGSQRQAAARFAQMVQEAKR